MEVVRLETVNNREGNPEVFCEVIFDTDTYGKINFGHWLTPKEYARFVADNTTIDAIMESYRTTAERIRAQS